MADRRRRERLARGALGLLGLAGLAEAVTRLELVDPAYLPPASAVLATVATLLADPAFLGQMGATLGGWGLGLLLAAAVAVPAGLLLGISRRGYRASIVIVELLRPIPSVALIPLAILLLGRGLDMQVTLVAYASAWPILFNTLYGVRELDPLGVETARAFGLGPGGVLWRVTLPAILPFAWTGVRIAAAIALILAISVELIAGGRAGIGTWMLVQSQAGAPREHLYGGIVVAGLLGVAINAVLVGCERRWFSWHQRVRASS